MTDDVWTGLLEGAEADVAGGKERLFAALYSELHRIAERQLRGSSGVPISPTTLLHELTSAALARGERLEGLTVTRPTLEDIYLELTAAGEPAVSPPDEQPAVSAAPERGDG